MKNVNNNNNNLRQEIKEIVSELALDYDRTTSVDPDDVTEKVIELFEKRIDDKILDIKKARKESKSLDFEGDSNLESQIEMLEEWKEELLK